MFGHWTYLVLELVWALPVLGSQWAAGFRTLLSTWRVVAVAVAVLSAYLTVSDGFAIRSGIWQIHGSRASGIVIGPVPVEEVLFFLFTNLMIVQTVVLIRRMEAGEPGARLLRAIADRARETVVSGSV